MRLSCLFNWFPNLLFFSLPFFNLHGMIGLLSQQNRRTMGQHQRRFVQYEKCVANASLGLCAVRVDWLLFGPGVNP